MDVVAAVFAALALACAVAAAVVVVVVVAPGGRRRQLKKLSSRTRALDDAGLVFQNDGGPPRWRERTPQRPAAVVVLKDHGLDCAVAASDLCARVASGWARHGVGVRFLPHRCEDALLDDEAVNAALGALLDERLSLRLEDGHVAVSAAAAVDDVEAQVVRLMARTRALTALLTEKAAALPVLDDGERKRALVEA